MQHRRKAPALMTTDKGYSYSSSVKSDRSDELINTAVVRPIAGLLVRLLYRTPVTPNQVTIAATITGLAAAAAYAAGNASSTLLAGCLLWAKDILDSADGQLARAKSQYSRAGRFLDSIGDLAVSCAVFAAITGVLVGQTGSVWYIPLGLACLVGMTLRISYHVFYQVSYLHLQDTYVINRTNEELRPDDFREESRVIRLQRIYLALYGWQDRMMAAIDQWCSASVPVDRRQEWYRDGVGIRLSGFLGMGTEILVVVLFSLGNLLGVYLWVNLLVQNAVWLACVVYRRAVLAPRLRRGET